MFHVPNQYRITRGLQASTPAFGNNGAFTFPNKGGATRRRVSTRKSRELFVIASDGMGWEHVSVHVWDGEKEALRLPMWDEMCYVKDLFWDAEDVVIQYHPRKSEYVKTHPFVLHLWRPVDQAIPTPPPILVGILDKEQE